MLCLLPALERITTRVSIVSYSHDSYPVSSPEGRRLGHCKILPVSVDPNPVLHEGGLGTIGYIYGDTPSIVVF